MGREQEAEERAGQAFLSPPYASPLSQPPPRVTECRRLPLPAAEGQREKAAEEKHRGSGVNRRHTRCSNREGTACRRRKTEEEAGGSSCTPPANSAAGWRLAGSVDRMCAAHRRHMRRRAKSSRLRQVDGS